MSLTPPPIAPPTCPSCGAPFAENMLENFRCTHCSPRRARPARNPWKPVLWSCGIGAALGLAILVIFSDISVYPSSTTYTVVPPGVTLVWLVFVVIVLLAAWFLKSRNKHRSKP
jgi:hypothetical protein